MNLSTPTRQSVKGLIFIFLEAVRQGFRIFWPLIPALAVQKNLVNLTGLIPIAIGVILALLLTHTVLYYLNFYFYVKEDEFILKKGYLRKKVLAIPLERIQSVNTKQNPIQQALDVVSLELDTAGAVGKELKIHALEGNFAEALRSLLSEKKEEKGEQDVQTATPAETRETLILKLEPFDLFKIGLSQNHLRTALIVIAFGSQIIHQVRDVFKEQTDAYSGEVKQFLFGSGITLFLILGLFFLLASVAISLLTTLIKYYDFKLIKTGKAYRIEAGVINKRNVVVPHHKIQQLNWETGPVKKWFGLYTLLFKQAVSGQQKKAKPVDAPGCLQNHLNALRHDLFGEDQLSATEKISSDPYYFRRNWMWMGGVPLVALTPFLYSYGLYWVGVPLWLLATAAYSYALLKKSYFRMNAEQVRVSAGAIAHTWKQMELHKIQAVELRQTFFQKRRALASLKLMNASGTIRVPYIPEELARQVHDYVLFHTESSSKSWM